MYGTFNEANNKMPTTSQFANQQMIQTAKLSPQKSDKVDSDSRGTLSMSNPKNLSPKNTLFYKDGFKDTKILFGSSPNNEQITGSKLDKGPSKNGEEINLDKKNFEHQKVNNKVDQTKKPELKKSTSRESRTEK